jgi:DNA-binding transcriptional ArsR family regulator
MPGPKEVARSKGKLVKPAISLRELEYIAGRFKLLSDPTRLRILHILQSGERTVSEVLEMVGTTQANVSKHLGALSRAHMISRRKEGNNAFYSITDPVIFELCDLMCNRAPKGT